MLLTKKNKIASKSIYVGNVISLTLDTLLLPDGRENVKEIVEHNGGVVIACQPASDQLILIEQYRYPVDETLYELPAGRIEIGEEPFACAQRELIEETGYRASSWKELAQMYSAPGFCTELLHLYQATDLEFIGKNLDEDEETEVHILSLQTAWELVVNGQIRDAKTIAGLAMLLVPGTRSM